MTALKNNWKDLVRHKLKATAIHLLISLLIFAGILYIILYHWYPEPFFTAQGGWQGIQLMAFVDIVLGPTLTLIVFNHLKQRKDIIFDLSMIALVQVCALVLGGYAVYTQRPIALVYWATAFYTVTGQDYSIQGVDSPDFSQYSTHVPPLIYSRPVSTGDELKVSNELTNQSVPAYAHVSFYEPIDKHLPAIFTNEVNIWDVLLLDTEIQTQLDKITDGDMDAYKYVPLKAKYQNMILVLEEDGNLVGVVKAPFF